MLNYVHAWWLGWPILEHLHLLRFEELWCGGWSMTRSAILLKNLPSLVVWNVMGSNNLLILQASGCCHPLCRSLTHPHNGCNPKPWFFLHQTWLFSGWILGPCWFQQVFCSICGDWDAVQWMILPLFTVHPFTKLWTFANATRFFSCLLFNAGLWALIRPWRPLSERIRQTVLIDTGVSGDQFSCSSAAVEKGLALDCRSNKRSSRTVVLQGLPDLGLSWTSPVSLNLFLILSTWCLDTLKMSATSTADLVRTGSWRSALWSVVESLACC